MSQTVVTQIMYLSLFLRLPDPLLFGDYVALRYKVAVTQMNDYRKFAFPLVLCSRRLEVSGLPQSSSG